MGSTSSAKHPAARDQVQKALQIQSELFREGDYIIGQILIEKGWISEDLLNRCLLRQREDCLREIGLFESLPPEAIQGLARQSNHVLAAANSVIFRQLDVGDSYFLIISGEVVVTRSAEGGEETEVARLGPGEGFGEIALLTGGLRNATVTAVTKTVLIAVPKPPLISFLPQTLRYHRPSSVYLRSGFRRAMSGLPNCGQMKVHTGSLSLNRQQNRNRGLQVHHRSSAGPLQKSTKQHLIISRCWSMVRPGLNSGMQLPLYIRNGPAMQASSPSMPRGQDMPVQTIA